MAKASHFYFLNGSFFTICPTCLSRWVLGCSTSHALQPHHTLHGSPKPAPLQCIAFESLSSQCCLELSCSSFKAQVKCHLAWNAFLCCSRLIPVPPVLPQNLVPTAIRVVLALDCNRGHCVGSSAYKMRITYLFVPSLCYPLLQDPVHGAWCRWVLSQCQRMSGGVANRTDRGLPTCTFPAQPLEGSLTPHAALKLAPNGFPSSATGRAQVPTTAFPKSSGHFALTKDLSKYLFSRAERNPKRIFAFMKKSEKSTRPALALQGAETR